MFRSKECHVCKPKAFCKEKSGSRNMIIDRRIERVAGLISICPVAIGLMSLRNYMRRLKIRQ